MTEDRNFTRSTLRELIVEQVFRSRLSCLFRLF